jgi:hypothetical protein
LLAKKRPRSLRVADDCGCKDEARAKEGFPLPPRG